MSCFRDAPVLAGADVPPLRGNSSEREHWGSQHTAARPVQPSKRRLWTWLISESSRLGLMYSTALDQHTCMTPGRWKTNSWLWSSNVLQLSQTWPSQNHMGPHKKYTCSRLTVSLLHLPYLAPCLF